MTLKNWVRPNILAMAGYVPGEQPAAGQPVIKLNTNENPYGPPDVVRQAIVAAAGETLRLYPPPDAKPVREAAALAYGVQPEQVVVGNGSDDLLTMILRLFADTDRIVAAPDPTYTLYEPLTRMQNGRYVAVPWEADLSLPVAKLAALAAHLILVARPNAPTGHAVKLAEVADLCRRTPGVVVLDEAYADFADDTGLGLLADHPNLLLIRSFSKSLSLAGLRIGLGFMSPPLAQEMHKVRDSYNLDRIAQAAATAALTHLEAFRPAITAIRAERRRSTDQLRQRGFQVPESQANFILATVPPGSRTGADWTAALKKEGILIRFFAADPRLTDKLRITIGTPTEMNALLQAVDRILGNRDPDNA
ncbi:MAG: histidinol-phosphate transaminase [Magnetococcus sp. DMHC-1]|nr:histidinol-phosphate transaminase [Magnetococcales bacterium]